MIHKAIVIQQRGACNMASQDISMNNKVEYTHKKIHFIWDDGRLAKDVEILHEEFPTSEDLASADAVARLMAGTFDKNIQTSIYLRNLSTPEHKSAGMRPVLYGSGDYITQQLDDAHSLLIIGFPRGRDFVVQHLRSVPNDTQLAYEAQATIISCESAEEVGWNFIDELLKDTVSLVQHTTDRLQEWEEYLDWKEALISCSMFGGRYYHRCHTLTEKEQPRIQFDAIFQDEESCKRLLRAKDGVSAVQLSWSQNPWRYEFVGFKEQKGRVRHLPKAITFANATLLDGHWASKHDDVPPEATSAIYRPFIAHIECELPEHIDDEDSALQFLRRLPKDGFLTVPSPDLWPMQRMRRSILDFKQGRSDASNLGLWMFDISKARLPREEDRVHVTDWNNKDIADNASQCAAVEKMLSAPDVCLIQGPPGTGKTEVIAEAIYQFTKRGQRVLLASQSNDAVDNALERLPQQAGIRSIRIDMNERSYKNGVDNPYSERNVLHTFYKNSLGGHVGNILNGWTRLDNEKEVAHRNLQKAERLQREREHYLGEQEHTLQHLGNLQQELSTLRFQQQKLQESKECATQEAIALNNLQDNLLNDDGRIIYLSDRQRKFFKEHLAPFIEQAFTQGVVMDADINRFLGALRTLDGLSSKLSSVTKNSRISDDIQQLNNQRLKLQSEMPATTDATALSSWIEQIKEIDLKIDLMGARQKQGISLLERQLLTEELLVLVEQHDDYASKLVREITEKGWSLLQDITSLLRKGLVSSSEIEQKLKNLNEQQKVLEGRRRVAQEALQQASECIHHREERLEELRQSYKAEDISEQLLEVLRRAVDEADKRVTSSRSLRNTWENILNEYHKKVSNEETAQDDSPSFLESYVKSCNVVGTSCTASMHRIEQMGTFDVAIIDEVSKATPPELLMPLLHAKKAILVGDHRQLPPLFDEHEKSYEEVCKQADQIDETQRALLTKDNFHRFKKLITASMFKNAFEHADDTIRHSLTIQYRMHPDIMEVTNRFYENQLSCGWSKEEADSRKNHGITLRGMDCTEFLTPQKHACWIDSACLPDGRFCAESHPKHRFASSLVNPAEQRIILNLVRGIAENCKQRNVKKTIGIIFLYFAQVFVMRKELKKIRQEYREFIDISVDTVDHFQGREKNIIIVGMTRNKQSTVVGEHVVSFERINVAFSRAQELLLIVGAKSFFEKLSVPLPKMYSPETVTTNVYQHIIDHIRDKGCLAGPEKFLTKEDVRYIHDYYDKQDMATVSHSTRKGNLYETRHRTAV